MGSDPISELDLLVARGARRLGFEFKRTAAPELTRSMRVAQIASMLGGDPL